MSTSTDTLPRLRGDAVVQQVSDEVFVVKLPAEREYFSVGPSEAFLLQQLDGTTTNRSVRKAFAGKFHEELSRQDINDFLELAAARKLLERPKDAVEDIKPEPDSRFEENDDELESTRHQSVLYFRKQLFDPNQFFGWIEPKLSWIWSRSFLVLSSLGMLASLLILISNTQDLVASFSDAWRWETVALAMLTILITTVLHECAHGLTCKHFGGEVHDTGVLFILFMPCLYCNVSDAWLIPQKSRRLWITAAGGYCDLCLWAIAVCIWRITVPNCLINYLSFVVLSVCGTRGLINFNPLLRLDGYYLLSDGLGIPNLRQRGREALMGKLRWLLWGAEKPKAEAHGRLLFTYGLMTWVFSIGFLNVVLLKMMKYASNQFGVLGISFTGLLLVVAVRRVFTGFFRSEFMTMIKTRHKRTVAWVGGIAATLAMLFIIPIKYYATGDFVVRPGDWHEVHSPVTGFISRILVDEGSHVKAGDPIVQLTSTDLESQITTKEAELRGVDATLAKLRSGTRPEQLTAAEDKVTRLKNWVNLGQQEVERARNAHTQEIRAVTQRIERSKTQWEFAKQSYSDSERLYQLKALAGAQLRSEQVQLASLASQIEEAEADRRVKEAHGIRSIEGELARREQELADAESQLELLRAGTRPEEIAAEAARQDQLQQQYKHLKSQREKLIVTAPVSGVVATPRLKEKLGQLATPGLPICVIENGATSRAEISVPEDDMSGVRPGQSVVLKARALPFETFNASVDRIAPTATVLAAKQRNVLVVHCDLSNQDGRLCSGMTGFGRVFLGYRSLGSVLVSKALGYLRTEFWW